MDQILCEPTNKLVLTSQTTSLRIAQTICLAKKMAVARRPVADVKPDASCHELTQLGRRAGDLPYALAELTESWERELTRYPKIEFTDSAKSWSETAMAWSWRLKRTPASAPPNPTLRQTSFGGQGGW